MQMKIFILFIYFSTHFITIDGDSVVIRVDGDCRTVGHSIAQNHGFRIIRQVRMNRLIHLDQIEWLKSFWTISLKIFDGYCEIEADPSSVNYHRHRRSIEQGVDPAHLLSSDQRVENHDLIICKRYIFHIQRFNGLKHNKQKFEPKEKFFLTTLNGITCGTW